MDEIEQRLKDASDACIKNYADWRGKEKDSGVRESLQESIHELRKVASRLEIEMAVSERGDLSSKPIPIPTHRSSKANKGNNGEGNDILSDDTSGEDSKPKRSNSGGRGRGGRGGGRGRSQRSAGGNADA